MRHHVHSVIKISMQSNKSYNHKQYVHRRGDNSMTKEKGQKRQFLVVKTLQQKLKIDNYITSTP